MMLSGIMIVLTLIVLFFVFTYWSLFDGNKNFLLQHVVVRSGGYWKGKTDKISEILKIEPGSTNLFALDLAELRHKLESQPSISRAEVRRILPDTLYINITERIPTAFLYRHDSGLVTDQTGTLMSADSCVNLDKSMPVITGFRAAKSELHLGAQLEQIMPALRFIDSAEKIVKEIKLIRISMSNPKYFNNAIYIPYTRKRYTFYISRESLDYKLARLKELIPRLKSRQNQNATVIDMRYKGQAVVR